MRFKVGEIAIYAVARDANGIPRIGQQCTVHEIGTYKKGQTVKHPVTGGTSTVSKDGDYMVVYRDGKWGIPMDWQLRKINPPEEPKSIRRTEETKV